MCIFHKVLALAIWSWSAFGFSSLQSGLIGQHMSIGRNVSRGNEQKGLVEGLDSRLLSQVSVYDGAFSASTCEELHHLAVEHCVRGDEGSSLFTRPPHNERPLTPLEHAIDSALLALGDTTRKVEYWSRDEYMNIDVHADIDELHFEEQEENSCEEASDPPTIRCPKMGHVLYLMVEHQLLGPTCVFPTKRTAWNLASESANRDQRKQRSLVELVTIPAVQGRILRFPGSAMHSVPKPTHRWFLSKEEQQALQKEEDGNALDHDDDYQDDDDESTYHADDYEIDDYDENYEEHNIERSVLLFNTWPDHQPGPKGVNGDYISGAIPDGIVLDEEDLKQFQNSMEAQRLSQWETQYGTNAEALSCNPRSDWKQIPIDVYSSDSTTQNGNLRPSLMGSKSRRAAEDKFVCLVGPTPVLQEALQEQHKVWQFNMEE